IVAIDNKLEEVQDLEEEEEAAAAALAAAKQAKDSLGASDLETPQDEFMSESIYQKLPQTRHKRKRATRRISMPILHEHLHPGSQIKELQAHNDQITAIDFDFPFGTMVTAALDDTVRVWDLNAGRCMGFLEGHLSS